MNTEDIIVAKGYVDAEIMGGYVEYGNPYPSTVNTEMWNGTSWTK